MSDLDWSNSVPPRHRQKLAINIVSSRQLQNFNDRGVIPVCFDLRRSTLPVIDISGYQSESFSLWKTETKSGFVTIQNYSVDAITVRFVDNGRIVYRSKSGKAAGTPEYATLVGYNELIEVNTSAEFSAISATIGVKALIAANFDLNGQVQVLPSFDLMADMTTPVIKSLFLTIQQFYNRIQHRSDQNDLIAPLIEEIISYQLLSAWPRRSDTGILTSTEATHRDFRTAIDYIMDNISDRLTLADIAKSAGVSVRTLQAKFRNEIGQTPLQYIIDQRLMKVHQDLISTPATTQSISEISKRWGFVHLSDFSQRYRRLYGCTPSETRRVARGNL